MGIRLFTLRANHSGALYCNRSCLWRAVYVTTITRSICTKLGLWVKVVSSDHLQLIKFWLSCAPGKGVCGRAKIFGSALLQPARSVCVSERFFHLC